MPPQNVCPIMSGQFITAVEPSPTIYYQICIDENCRMWDSIRKQCGLKKSD
jgi:hypothetical protein